MSSLKQVPTWFKRTIVSAFVIALITFGINQFAPGVLQKITTWGQALLQPPPKQDTFIILLADLAGDDAESMHRKHLANVLEGLGGFRVYSIGKSFGGDPVAGDQTDARQQTIHEAKQYLNKMSADILIWGKYYEKTFQLGFISRDNKDLKHDGRLKSYSIQPDLTIPEKFSGDVRDLITLTVYANIRHMDDMPDAYMLSVMRPLVAKIEAYLKKAKGLTSDQERSAWISLGQAYEAMYILTNGADRNALLRLESIYQQALAITPRDNPSWADIQRRLGCLFVKLADPEGNATRLNMAVNAFYSAANATQRNNSMHWRLHADIADVYFTFSVKYKQIHAARRAKDYMVYAAHGMCYADNDPVGCQYSRAKIYAIQSLIAELESSR